MKWIDVNDRLPEKDGMYQTKTIEGSMNPQKQERTSFFRVYPNGARFIHHDWTKVTHWLDVKA